MAKFKLEPGEQQLMEGRAPYFKSRFALIDGPAYLTDRRFVHANNLMARSVGGLAGALAKPRIDLEIPLASIAGIGRDAHGRKNEPVLVLATVAGQDHRLATDPDLWLPAFDEALSLQGRRLVAVEPGRWTAMPG